jgi:hypothetical protein
MALARTGAYQIADEPTPSALGHLAVNPFWPMLASMLAGAWVGVPWFAFNALALGSATRRRELVWLLAGVLGAAAAVGAIFFAFHRGLVPFRSTQLLLRYGQVLVVAWRLTAAYAVYQLQESSFELHRHFGGRVVNGAPLVVLAAVFPVSRFLGTDEVSFFLSLVLG